MMPPRKKPKPRPPVPGAEPGQFTCYEARRTVGTFVDTSLAFALTTFIAVADTLATQSNVDTLWNVNTLAGAAGVIVVTLWRAYRMKQTNNSDRKT